MVENGFLPEYYGGLDFELVAEKEIDFPKCCLTRTVLMKRRL